MFLHPKKLEDYPPKEDIVVLAVTGFLIKVIICIILWRLTYA